MRKIMNEFRFRKIVLIRSVGQAGYAQDAILYSVKRTNINTVPSSLMPNDLVDIISFKSIQPNGIFQFSFQYVPP